MVVSRLRSIWTIPDLRNKILFTLGMLLVFRIVAYVPVPGIDAAQISKAINSNTNTGAEPDLRPARCLHRRFVAELLHRRDGRLSLHHRQHRRAAPAEHRPAPGATSPTRVSRDATASRSSRATSPCRWRCCRRSARWRCWCRSARSRPSQFNLFDRATVDPDAGDAHQPDRRYDVPRLARRADYRERHRQRHLAHHLRQHHGQGPADNRLSARHRAAIAAAAASTTAASCSCSCSSRSRLAMIFVMVMVYMAQRRVPVQYPTKRRFLAGSRGGQRDDLYPLAGQQRGYDSADLCQSDLAAADGRRQLHVL